MFYGNKKKKPIFVAQQFGLVWHDLSWFGLVRLDLPWFGLVWLDLSWFGMALLRSIFMAKFA